MPKIIIANWNRLEESLGGQEIFFKMLSKILNAKRLSYTKAENVLGMGLFANAFATIYRGYVIDSYLKWHEDLFSPDLIIKNSAVGGFIKLKTPQATIFQDPYYSILNFMLSHKIFLSKSEHYLSCIDLMRRTAKYSANIAVSNFMKKDMELCGIKCDKVIEEGIDMERFVPLEKDKENLKKMHNLPLDKKIGIAIIKFTPTKGWDFLSRLINEFKDIHWIVVLTEEIKIKPKLKNVTVLERVIPELMPSIYNHADFFISTSPVESFGLSACEAASCNLPIINYKTGFAWDWWDERIGIRVDDWTYEAFENAVKNLFKGVKYEPRKAIIERGFTLEVMEKNWKDYIENLLNK